MCIQERQRFYFRYGRLARLENLAEHPIVDRQGKSCFRPPQHVVRQQVGERLAQPTVAAPRRRSMRWSCVRR
jgi:hypothetical protein